MTTSYNGYGHPKDTEKKDTYDGGGYGIFWDEYRSIEQSTPPSATGILNDSEDGVATRDGK